MVDHLIEGIAGMVTRVYPAVSKIKGNIEGNGDDDEGGNNSQGKSSDECNNAANCKGETSDTKTYPPGNEVEAQLVEKVS